MVALIVAAACATHGATRRPPHLPASFYEVVAAGDLGLGAEANLSWSGPTMGRLADRSAPGAIRSPAFGMGEGPRFIVDRDSLLYRNGRERVELATLTIIRVAEVAYPENSPWKWAQVTYRDAIGEPHTVYFRQANLRAQGTLVAAIRYAAETARATQPEESDPTRPR